MKCKNINEKVSHIIMNKWGSLIIYLALQTAEIQFIFKTLEWYIVMQLIYYTSKIQQ